MAPSMTIEERQARITEIIARQEELDTEFRGMTFTDEARTEFESLAEERVEQDRAVAELEQRRSYLEEQARQARTARAAASSTPPAPVRCAATTSTT
jgi:chromosome segregation ATPase